jgi:hypothetical protein
MKASRQLVLAMATLAMALVAFHPAQAGAAENKLFTSYNLWFEHPQKIASTGFKKGTLLPAGTEIKKLDVDGNEIEFVNAANGMEMRIIFKAKHHPGIPVKVFADRLFTTKDFAALTAGMTPEEIAAIKKGELTAGMSRAAVLVARGYPPESKTPSMDRDEWTYMVGNFGAETLRFKDGKLTLEAPPPPPPAPAKAEAPKAPPKYLEYNVWFEDREKVPSANYQAGSLLPAGTEIERVLVLSDKVEFTVVSTKMDYEIEFNEKHHPGLPIEKFAERLVGGKGFDELTSAFTAEEVKAIKAGEIKPGMSRAAVLVAAGYPPENKTATLERDTWTYFANRFNSYKVEFKDDKVQEVSKK